MKRAKLTYYCPECDTTVEKFVEFEGSQLSMSTVEQSIPCDRTKNCRKMKLTKLGLPDNIKDNRQKLLG